MLAVAVLAVFSVVPAHADIIFMLGNNPQPNEANVLLNSGVTGTTVTGSLNGVPGITVDFTSSQTLLEPSSGNARVAGSPEGTPLTNLTISLANGLTYNDLIINPFIGGCQACAGGTSTITVHALDSHGNPEPAAVLSNFMVGNGNNFLTIFATNGESILNTSISVPGGFNDLRQPRISGPFAPVPEPASMFLLGSGLLGVAAAIRRKRK